MLNERKLTGREVMKRETSLRGLKKNKSKLVKKYGRDAEKIMYGIAMRNVKNSRIKLEIKTNITKSEIKELIKPLIKGYLIK